MNRPNYADHTFAPWRVDGEKRILGPQPTWKEPLQWDREAKAGGRQRVLVDVDVFEDWQGAMSDLVGGLVFADGGKYQLPMGFTFTESRPATMADVRRRLSSLIDSTPNLDWLLVTERPENIVAMMPPLGWIKHPCPKHVSQFRLECPACNAKNSTPVTRKNLWLGVRITDQATADERIPHLLKVPAEVRFVDAVLRGPVDLDCYAESGCSRNWLDDEPGIDWLTVSGESGPHARPMHLDWVRSLRDQCTAAGVPFWFDGWGQWEPVTPLYEKRDDTLEDGTEIVMQRDGVWNDRDGQPTDNRAWLMRRVGKAKVGRTLDGREWEEVPA